MPKNALSYDSKTKKCMDYLELIHDPRSADVYRVAKKVGCCQKTAWNGLRLLREDQKKKVEYYTNLKKVTGAGMWLLWLYKESFQKYFPREEMPTSYQVRMDDVERILERNREAMELDHRGFSIKQKPEEKS